MELDGFKNVISSVLLIALSNTIGDLLTFTLLLKSSSSREEVAVI